MLRRRFGCSVQTIHSTAVETYFPLPTACLLSVLLVSAANGPAAAQIDAEEVSEATLLTLDVGEVSITANREPTALSQVGSAITVITREELEDQQIRHVSDILRQVPGVAVSSSGPDGSLTQVRIRGAEARHTLVLIDGVRVNDPTAIGAVYDFGNLLAEDVERIEVVRGPQSALYPSDAIGGVINIITRRGSGAPSVTASVEGGSYGTVQAASSVSGGTDLYDGRLGVTYFRTDGISAARQGTELDGYENLTVSGRAGLRPTDTLSFEATGRYLDADRDIDDGFTGSFVDDSLAIQRTQEFSGRLSGQLELMEGAWLHEVGVTVAGTDREIVDSTSPADYSARSYGADYQTSYLLETDALVDAAHRFTFAYEHVTEEGDFNSFGAPAVFETISANSFIGEYQLGLFDEVFLTASVRHDINSEFPDATTWRLTGAYLQPDLGTRVHASVGTGVKNPTLNDLYVDFPNFFYFANPNLVQEESFGFDIGIEQPLFDDRLVLGATYFDNDIENLFATQTNPNTFVSTIVNVPGESTRRGAELSSSFQATEDLMFEVAYTYTHAEAANGSRIVNVPRHTVSGSVSYSFLDGDANITATVVGEYDRLISFPTTSADDFTLVNLAGSYQVLENVELFARVENLLDQDYTLTPGFDQLGIGAYGGIRVRLG
ncbi:MAG: TonB-dependent receptor, partial [Rhodospirillaceae bacterium]|nr:TonB-dependent receptor [Rhodospirillaceae bacterium]